MTTEELRAAIETALQRRDPCADVCSDDAPNGFSGRDASAIVMHGYAASRGDSDDEALRRLARLLGLRDDGSDPAEEVERLRAALDDADNLASCQRDTIGTLTRALHDAADRLGCADYDDVCAAVADALDDAEKREREHVDEANALRLERDRLRVDNVRLLNTIESLSAQLCDTDRGRGEAREEARRLRADNDRLDDAAKGALDDLAAVRRERDEARRDAAKREDAAFADGAAKMQRVVADEILGFVGTIKDNATMTDGAAAETLRRVADLVECLALRIRDMTFEVASALAR